MSLQADRPKRAKKRSKVSIAEDPCGCVALMNDALAPKGMMLRCSTSLATGRQFMRVEVEKLDGGGSRKAAVNFTLVPIHCPFCGEKLP